MNLIRLLILKTHLKKIKVNILKLIHSIKIEKKIRLMLSIDGTRIYIILFAIKTQDIKFK